jgi:hypothetical protein
MVYDTHTLVYNWYTTGIQLIYNWYTTVIQLLYENEWWRSRPSVRRTMLASNIALNIMLASNRNETSLMADESSMYFCGTDVSSTTVH